MTTMQLLVPLEDDGNGVCNDAAEALPEGREASRKGMGMDEDDKNQDNKTSSSSSVMSENLRNQFEAVKTAIRQVKRAESQEMLSSDAHHDDTTKAGDGSNSSTAEMNRVKDLPPRDAVDSGHADAQSENKSNNTQELKRKAEQLAFETAAAVDEEISRWRNSIADLEALLAEEELDDDYHDGQPGGQESNTGVHRRPRPMPLPLHEVDVPRFPALASVIPDDTDDDDAVDDNVQ